MQDIIHIHEGLVLEAHPDGRYILLRREGECGSIRIHLNEVRYLADAICTMAAGMRGGRGTLRMRAGWSTLPREA